jgi:predicted ATPase
MIRALRFHNYRVLRDAKLPLQPFTLLVGPNGSGKSTVMHALSTLRSVASHQGVDLHSLLSVSAEQNAISVEVDWSEPSASAVGTLSWPANSPFTIVGDPNVRLALREFLQRLRVYSLNEKAVISWVSLRPNMDLREDGADLAGVLDQMRDRSPEAFEALNSEFTSLLPEFDRILFETPGPGTRAFMLRTRDGQHSIRAADLSQGTVLALAILTLAHLSAPPSMVCLEEPDRGIHPRLYRDIQDALYRLAYPQSYGLDRDPVQVLVTTHSPYLLDLHREHPEEVVIAQKNGTSATFQKLTDREDIQELLSEASLGELWYSGVLGGVPVAP